MNSAKPYLGCKIGLISKAQNRYVGMLYTIDKVNSTVVLAKVKCHGTEDRPADRPTPPRNDVYDYITFRGSDITDISLCDPPSSQHGLPPDPAILLSSGAIEAHSTLNLGAVQIPVYHQFPSQPLHSENYAAALGIGAPIKRPMVEKAVQTIGIERSRRRVVPLSDDDEWEGCGPLVGASIRQPLVRQPTRRPGERDLSYQRPPMTIRGGPRYPPARRAYDYRQQIENIPPRMQQGSWRGQNPDGALRFDTDFDFDYSNAQFMKDDDVQDRGREKEPSDSPFEDDPFGPNRFYNKAKSFYDNIPSEKKKRLSWAEERQRNIETFGAPGRPLRSPGFRGGFSRGRGQRTGQGVFV